MRPEPFRPVLRGVLLTGRHTSPYLAELDRARAIGEAPRPDGQPVELDLERDVPAAADALRAADRGARPAA